MITDLHIENFRCIERATIDFDAHGTGIVGGNASGKTSLLEAIFFLGHGRSFRTNIREKLLARGADSFRIVAHLGATAEQQIVAGTEYCDRATVSRLGGAPVASLAPIAALLPIQVIDPGIHRLVEEGPTLRRRLIDWGVFHVEQTYLDVWRRYYRALNQRNSALRQKLVPEQVSLWDRELARCGHEIDRARTQYLETLQGDFERLAHSLLGETVTLEYRRGWPMDESLDESLNRSRARDDQMSTTTKGPHRADLVFSVKGVAARDRVSRGQQKMLASAFVLSQVSVREQTAGSPTTLLLDDPAAELDVDNLGKLLRAIDRTPSQLIATSVSEGGLKGLGIARTFHVEQGIFKRML